LKEERLLNYLETSVFKRPINMKDKNNHFF